MLLKRWTTFDNRGFEPKLCNSSADLQRIRDYSNMGAADEMSRTKSI